MNDAAGEKVGVGVRQHLLAGINLDRVMEKAPIVLAAEVFALNLSANKDGQLLLLRPGFSSNLCSRCRAHKERIIQVQQT